MVIICKFFGERFAIHVRARILFDTRCTETDRWRLRFHYNQARVRDAQEDLRSWNRLT